MTIVKCPNCGAKNRVDETRAILTQPKCGRCGMPLSPSRSAPSEASDRPIVVTDATFERDVLGAHGMPILVDFWAEWCGPCRMLAPTLEELARQSGGRYSIAKLNVDENPHSAQRYHISSIPAMLIFKDGQKVDQLIGLAPRQSIVAALSKWK